jgi:hypothetical protein
MVCLCMVCLRCVNVVECDYAFECHCVSVSVSQSMYVVCLRCVYVVLSVSVSVYLYLKVSQSMYVVCLCTWVYLGCVNVVQVTRRLSVSIRRFVGAPVSLSLTLSRSPSLPPFHPSSLSPSLPPPLSPQHAHLHPVLLRGVFIWALLSRDQKLQRFFFIFFIFFMVFSFGLSCL